MATHKVFKMVTQGQVGSKKYCLLIVKIFSGIKQLLEVPDFCACLCILSSRKEYTTELSLVGVLSSSGFHCVCAVL